MNNINNRAGVFENSECRRLFAAFFALTVLLAFAVCISGFVCQKQLEAQLLQRECTVAGCLINSGAAKQADIINAYVSRDSAQNASTGAKAFEKAGYSDYTVEVLAPFISGNTSAVEAAVIAASLAVFLLFGVLTYFALASIYRRVEETGGQALKISRGDYGARLKEDSEGAFSRMDHAFNEMSYSVNAGIEKLGQQRLFLKNLISDISHQLKTPLAALKMYNEIILQEPISENAADFTKKSGEQLDRMEWLILGLLKMARVEAGYLDMDMQINSVSAVAQAAAGDFAVAAKEKNIELAVKSDGNPAVLCDAGWLKEAMGNVIKNCIEYTPDGGRITIDAAETPVMVTVKISDTGKGIHPDDLPYVFRRFYRGRRSVGAGVGIGLNLAKAITEQMGGTLSAGGEYGQGAVFTFSFLKEVM